MIRDREGSLVHSRFPNYFYQLMEYLYITCIGLLIFFSISLLTKGKKPLSEKIFSVWIVLMIFTVLSFLLHVKALSGRFPVFNTFICDSHLAHGVLLYLYVRAFTDPTFGLKKKHLWHALPILALVVFKLVLNFVYGEMECYTGGVCAAEDDNIYVQLTFLYKYIVLGTYIFFTWKMGFQYGKDAKTPREQMRFGWVKQIYKGGIFLLAGILLLQLGRILFPDLFWERMLLGNTLTTLFIFIFLYIGNSYTYIFVSPSKKRFVNLSESFNPDNCRIEENQKNWEDVYSRLESYMKTEQPYTEGHLSINNLSEKMNIPVQEISQSINNMTGKNFNDYINKYRVKKLKLLLDDPLNHKYKIMSLAYDCGFTSKSSLIRLFKSHTGQTPSRYLAEVISNS
jgi:AraC-like DNA-binding protein